MELLGFAVTIFFYNADTCGRAAVRTQRHETVAERNASLNSFAIRLLPPLNPDGRYEARCEDLDVLCRQIAHVHSQGRGVFSNTRFATTRVADQGKASQSERVSEVK